MPQRADLLVQPVLRVLDLRLGRVSDERATWKPFAEDLDHLRACGPSVECSPQPCATRRRIWAVYRGAWNAHVCGIFLSTSTPVDSLATSKKKGDDCSE